MLSRFRIKFSNWSSPRSRDKLPPKSVSPPTKLGQRWRRPPEHSRVCCAVGYSSDRAGSSSTVPSSPDAAIAPGQPEVKDYQLSFDGDVAHGQFLTQVAGKDGVGHPVGAPGGVGEWYATFDPTEFKVGD